REWQTRQGEEAALRRRGRKQQSRYFRSRAIGGPKRSSEAREWQTRQGEEAALRRRGRKQQSRYFRSRAIGGPKRSSEAREWQMRQGEEAALRRRGRKQQSRYFRSRAITSDEMHCALLPPGMAKATHPFISSSLSLSKHEALKGIRTSSGVSGLLRIQRKRMSKACKDKGPGMANAARCIGKETKTAKWLLSNTTKTGSSI
ncbi:MAG: hypothetical protein IKI39_07895, partial [Oscillospiraceae bacterium]|nr:hypothetical protein [Oscillospiraceae bacterium]